MLIFGLHSTFDFQLGWLMDSNPICHLQYKESWILSELQLFQFFPTEVAQNDLEWLIFPDSQLFQYFATEVAQNDSGWPILPDLQLFQSFPTEMAPNDLGWPISPDSQLF